MIDIGEDGRIVMHDILPRGSALGIVLGLGSDTDSGLPWWMMDHQLIQDHTEGIDVHLLTIVRLRTFFLEVIVRLEGSLSLGNGLFSCLGIFGFNFDLTLTELWRLVWLEVELRNPSRDGC